MYDFHGKAFLDTNNLGPRFGAIYDPFSDGRSKISFVYGRYFEAIPLNVAARYFGGEGILVRNGVPLGELRATRPVQLDRRGRVANCSTPPSRRPADDRRRRRAAARLFNNGSNYPVQANLKGQYHNEIVATAEREIIEDLTVRLDYQHRWLGEIIEDGAADPTGFTFVLANPGDVPKSALDDARTATT